MSTRRRWAAAAAAFLAAAIISPAGAQIRTFGVGRAPTADEVKAWDLTIPADGEGLPPGSGTAALGQPIFVARCASCHGEKGQNGKYDRLVGGRGTLATDKPVRTIGSFWPYAPTLWSYIRRSQPIDEPGSLTADQAYALTAYLLHLNGIIGEHDVMDNRTLPKVKMPNRDGFVPDPRPDVGPAKKPGKR
ncbi:MAG TPA: cytochrome c [Methylomirabilota bacterium]|jgi:cytochrome c|nr:cytochrome c [Methylomirabilota bacterium]